jgi:amino acid transporter
MEPITLQKPPGLFTAVGIGVGTMIGSGWLFSAYYAAQYAGPAALFSWLMGAGISLILALLLAEIAGMYKSKALFSRLIIISHNNADFGFVIAIAGWLCMVLVIPTEAAATIQYLSSVVPALSKYLFAGHRHTLLGSAVIIFLVLIYSTLNFWGIRTFARINNTLVVFKILIPIFTALILMAASFHPVNFTSQGFMPYGYSRIFSGVIVCGIFYTFYGFSLVAMYGAELKNPQKNIPRALLISVFICFIIYALLQIAFVGGLPSPLVDKGWSHLNFISPFAQLLLLLNMHFLTLWTFVLYMDATVSPSGTAMICLSSATRMLTGMAQDNQLPRFFDRIHPVYLISRTSLIFTTIICCFILLFFKNWQELMILVSVFQLTTCVAIPIAFTKLRSSSPDTERIYRVKIGNILSYFIFMVLSFFAIQVDVLSLSVCFFLYVLFFVMYLLNYYRLVVDKIVKAICSSWSIFFYWLLVILFSYLNQKGMFNLNSAVESRLNHGLVCGLFLVIFSITFWLLINQKDYNKTQEHPP